MTMQASAGAAGRPVAITVICIIMAILVVLALIGLVTAAGQMMAVGMGTFIYSVASVIITGVCAYGLWMMKKWALYLYTALFVVGLIMTLLTSGLWAAVIGEIIPLILLAILWAYQARMT